MQRTGADVARAMGHAADAPVADGMSSPEGAATLVRKRGPRAILLGLAARTGPREELPDLAGGAQFGPWPPSLLFVGFDGDELVRCALHADRGSSAPEPRADRGAIAGIDLRSGRFDWFKAKVKRVAAAQKADEEPRAERWWAELVISATFDEKREEIVVGFAIAESEGAARARLEPLETALRDRASATDADANDAAGLAPSDATLVWGREGDVIVLRDFANPGPRRYASIYRTTSIVSLLVAGGLAISLAIAAIAGAPVGALIGTGAVSLVLFINAFAFFQIAGHASRYVSESLALAWFGDDRVVVGPWLSRYGAVDTRPSGRLGAAIPTAEINAIACFERDGAHAVEMASEHGPIEIVRARSGAIADSIKRVADALLVAIAAPKKAKKARPAAVEAASRG